MTSRRLGAGVTALVAGLSLVVACGGSGSTSSKSQTKAEWMGSHGAAISAVNTELDFARSALDKGERDAILSACNLLNDDLVEARKAVPAPNSSVDAALRKGLDAVTLGASDCLQGARVASVASLNERAMAELTTARADMDAVNQAIANWR